MTLTFAGTAAGRFANVRRPWIGARTLGRGCRMSVGDGVGGGRPAVVQDARRCRQGAGEAAKSGDVRAIMRVLGNESAELASSGDPVADAATRKQFFQSFETKHRIAMDGEEKATLMVGEGDWPFPIPLIRRNEIWRFDAAAGRQEILQRRIGRNELSAIQACRAFVDAQYEYADQDHTGTGVGVDAQRIVSRPGKKDGLYWPTQAGDKSAQSRRVNWPPAPAPRAIGLAPAGRRFMATTTSSSPGRGRVRRAAPWTMSCAAA